MQKLTKSVPMIVSIFYSLFSVCCISLAPICISYAFDICYTIQSSTRCPRERVAVNIHGTVSTLARLKIIASYQQELVSHPMSEHVEAFS